MFADWTVRGKITFYLAFPQPQMAGAQGKTEKEGIVYMRNGLEDQYVIKNNKRLRYGYTTGSCAAGAARGAVRMPLSGETLSEVELDTPKGITLALQLTILPGAKPMSPVRYRRMQGISNHDQRDPGLCKSGEVFCFSGRTGRAGTEQEDRPRIIWTEGSVWGVSPSRDFPRT